MRLACWLALGACVGFVIFAGPLVSTLYTERYADAADSARLLVVGQGLRARTAEQSGPEKAA